ncbi:MAG: tyrosine-protein kinase family protein, partial [Lachnospiraceae bacterium]
DIIKQQDNLDNVTYGRLPPNPSELLTRSRWEEFINQSKEKYDVIFVDLPPLGIVSDALALVDIATAYILVVREKVTKFEREKMIVQKLEPLNANICGFVYNGISMKSPDYNYRHYGYGKGYEN